MNNTKRSSFNIFFAEFPKLYLAGLMFSIPLAAFIALSIGISILSGFNNIIIWGLAIIPSTLFLPGLVKVILKYSVEKNKPPVIKTFFTAIKENFIKFLLHGIAVYIISACSFFAIIFYYAKLEQDIVFGCMLAVYIVFSLILITMMLYVPIISVAYKMNIRNIYKASLKLVFSNIAANILTLLIAAALSAIVILSLIYAKGLTLILLLVFVTALFPLIMFYTAISIIAKGIRKNLGEFSHLEPIETEKEPYSQIDFSEINNADDDYIFVNGRMIKNQNKKSP